LPLFDSPLQGMLRRRRSHQTTAAPDGPARPRRDGYLVRGAGAWTAGV